MVTTLGLDDDGDEEYLLRPITWFVRTTELRERERERERKGRGQTTKVRFTSGANDHEPSPIAVRLL
jgi:hypothetical protein